MNDKINIALIVHESNSPLSMISVVRIKKYFFRKTSFLPQFFQHDIILKTYNAINETGKLDSLAKRLMAKYTTYRAFLKLKNINVALVVNIKCLLLFFYNSIILMQNLILKSKQSSIVSDEIQLP